MMAVSSVVRGWGHAADIQTEKDGEGCDITGPAGFYKVVTTLTLLMLVG